MLQELRREYEAALEDDLRVKRETARCWYRDRFGSEVDEDATVFINPRKRSLFILLASIYALTYPEKAALWYRDERRMLQAITRVESNRRARRDQYLHGHHRDLSDRKR